MWRLSVKIAFFVISKKQSDWEILLTSMDLLPSIRNDGA